MGNILAHFFDLGNQRLYAVEHLIEGHCKLIDFIASGFDGYPFFERPSGYLLSRSVPGPPNETLVAEVQAAFVISRHRTLHQDCAFGIRQIVDMAMRALSPSTNDTTTAVMCVDYLTAILARLAARDIPSPYRFEDGELRVIAIGQTFTSLVAESFDQIRTSAAGNVALMLRMLGAVQTIGRMTDSPVRRRVLREQLDWIAELAERTVASPHDRERFSRRKAAVLRAGTRRRPRSPAAMRTTSRRAG